MQELAVAKRAGTRTSSRQVRLQARSQRSLDRVAYLHRCHLSGSG